VEQALTEPPRMNSDIGQRLSLACIILGALVTSTLSQGYIGWILIAIGSCLFIMTGGRPLRTPLDWAIVLLTLTALTTLLVTPEPQTSRTQVSQLFAGIIALYVTVVWSTSPRLVRLVAIGLICIGVGLVVVAPFAVNWSAPQTKALPAQIYAYFPTVVTNTIHPNVLASALLICLPLATAWFIEARQAHKRWIEQGALFVAVSAMLAMFVLTQSRGGLIALSVGLIVVIALMLGKKWAVMFLFVCISVSFLVVLVAQSTSIASVDNSLDTNAVQFRLMVWRLALSMASDFVFTGAGMGTFNDTAMRLYGFANVDNPGAHNLYLQVAVDLGLTGLVAFVAILLSALAMGWVNIGRIKPINAPALQGIAVGAYGALIGLLIHGFVESTVWGTRASIMPWLLIGIITAIFTNNLHQQQP
jgi:putative inorganic carbon (HCO3(-)) transporter